MTLGINTLVDAIAPILIGRLANNLCPGAEGALVVGVDVVHKNVEPLAYSAAERSWTLPCFNLRREPQHDQAVLQLYLAVHYLAGLVSHSQADFKAKGFDQKIYGGGEVVIKKVRSDSRHVARGIWDHVDASSRVLVGKESF